MSLINLPNNEGNLWLTQAVISGLASNDPGMLEQFAFNQLDYSNPDLNRTWIVESLKLESKLLCYQVVRETGLVVRRSITALSINEQGYEWNICFANARL